MIIGITGNKCHKKELMEFFSENTEFKYFNIDEIIQKVYCKKITTYDDYLNLKNFVDKIINELTKEYKNLIIDYTLLEDSFVFNKCDAVFKVEDINYETSNFEILNLFRSNNIDLNYKSTNNNFVIDFNNNWKEQLLEYINFNFNNTIKVTVIVPIHNTLPYISKCVESIMKQTYRNLEIILINDGSTDKSLEMCEFLSKMDSRIIVIDQENIGLAETRNKGMQIATGEYITFVDSDDYIDCKMIETMLRTILKTNSDVCECGFYIHMKDGNIKDVSCEQKGTKYVEGNLNLMNAYADATILIPAWDKLYKLSSIRDIKFDKSCFKEDADYIYKLCMAGKTFSLVPASFYHYIKRKDTSLTGAKISYRLFGLQRWGFNAYNEVLSKGEEYRDSAERILYNSLVHILRNYMRDFKNNILKDGEYQQEIQEVVNNLMNLLLNVNDVKRFRKLDEVLDIINELIDANILDKSLMPSIDLSCIGILWNSLDEELMSEALTIIREYAEIRDCIKIDLQDDYRNFIYDIYYHNREFEGVPYMKAGILIDRYDSNSIIILNMIIKIKNYMYFNANKGYMFEEIAKLKNLIRKYFKLKIREYAYDNIFHLTVDSEEYNYTDEVCRKYIPNYRGAKNERQ